MMTPDERRLLIYDAIAGDFDKVRQLLQSKADDYSHRPKPGDTALSLASAFGFVDVVREQLKHDNVDVSYTNEVGKTSLILACQKGDVGVVCESTKRLM
jgi:ankyrin repeat protein